MRQFRNTNYWVTESGDIYSHWPERVINQGSMYNGKKYECFKTIPEKWKKLKPGKTTFYKKIRLMINNNPIDFLLHRIIAECYLGPCPIGLEVDHIDNNPSNNHYTNLQYITHTVNIRKRTISLQSDSK